MTRGPEEAEERVRAIDLKRRLYAKEAPRYDREADMTERWLFGTEHRRWACSKATGDTLEVGIGTGLNLPHYPPNLRITGADLSPDMLAMAVKRAKELRLRIRLTEADAEHLPFADRSFDTVVCTYALCSVRHVAAVIAEMHRVLRPGGRLILVDHIRSSVPPIFWLQWLWEFIPRRTKGEYSTRRPSVHVMAGGFGIEARDRLRAGIIERLVAVKTSVRASKADREAVARTLPFPRA
jgi:ubiquinone/menaquinone biosynthesis C-methylase UbiE